MTWKVGKRKKSSLRARRVVNDTAQADENRPDGLVECTCEWAAPKTGLPGGIGVLASGHATGKKLDGPLDSARFTIKPVDPKSLSESRRRATLARFANDPHPNEEDEVDPRGDALDAPDRFSPTVPRNGGS